MPSVEYDPSRSALYTPARRATLFVSGGTYSPLQLGIEAARLAYLKAESSDDEHHSLVEALSRVGFGAPRSFVDAATKTQAFGAYREADRTALLAFRGTQPEEVADLATDLQAHTVDWTESAGRVHMGFAAAIRSVVPAIRDWLEVDCHSRSRLILCGHSLGAALATLAATVWQPTLLVTLGSPRVGNPAFAATLNGTSVMRLVDCCDVVTQLPPESPWYTHVGPLTYVDREGATPAQPDAGVISHDRLEARNDYITEYAWKIGAVLLRDLADHSPINYARAFF